MSTLGVVKITNDLQRRVDRLETKQSPIRGGTDKTISGGVITADRPYHHLIPETGITDDLVTINAPWDGKFLLLHTRDSGDTITVKDGTGNLDIAGDCVLDSPVKTLYVMWDAVQAKWLEVGRSPVASTGGGKQYATFVVAAYDSTTADKANADYVCGGTADQTDINSALSATTPSGFRRVLLCAGTYNIDGQLAMTAGSVLEGQGVATVITANSGSPYITLANNCEIKNLIIDGNGGYIDPALNSSGADDWLIENVYIKDVGSVDLTSCNRFSFHRCEFSHNTSVNYYLTSCNHFSVIGCEFTHDSGATLWFDGSTHFVVTGNTINGGDLLYIDGGSFGAVVGNKIFNCGEGVGVYNSSKVLVTGNMIVNCVYGVVFDNSNQGEISGNTCAGDGSDASAYGVHLDGSSYCLVSGNNCYDNFNFGVYLIDSDHNNLCGNTLVGNSNSDSTNTSLNNTAGILLQTSDTNYIADNLIRKSSPGSSNFQSWGIKLESGCTDNLIADNDMRASGNDSDLNDAGTGTNYRQPNGLFAGTSTVLTIASGAVTITRSFHRLLPESGTTDDLDTINGGVDGMELKLRVESSGHTLTAKDGTGNMVLAGDFAMDNQTDTLSLIYDASLSKWLELARSNNA